MNKISAAATLLGMAFTATAWANPGLNGAGYDTKAACERYAQEDQIKPEHMADYMSQCLRDLSNDLAPEQDMEQPPIEEKLDKPTEAPINKPADAPVNKPADAPVNKPKDAPTNKAKEAVKKP